MQRIGAPSYALARLRRAKLCPGEAPGRRTRREERRTAPGGEERTTAPGKRSGEHVERRRSLPAYCPSSVPWNKKNAKRAPLLEERLGRGQDESSREQDEKKVKKRSTDCAPVRK